MRSAERYNRPVIHGMMKGGPRENQAIHKRHCYAPRDTGFECPEHPTRGRAVQVKFFSISAVQGRNSIRPAGDEIQCALSASSFARVSMAIQFTSQVLPPSSENACSKRHEPGVMSDITNRTRTVRPLGPDGSVSKNSPRPFLNSPIVGWLRVPPLLLAKFRLHWRDCGLYRRRFRPSK